MGHAAGVQRAGGQALALSHETKEKMFGADVGMAQRAGFLQGQVHDHVLGPRRERNLAWGCHRAGTEFPLDPGAERVQVDAEVLQGAGGDRLPLAQQRQK